MRLRLERRTELALRALLLLDATQAVTPAKTLAPRLHTTADYLPHVMKPLVEAGWVSSVTGPRGGYQLLANLDERSVLELIAMFEGDPDNKECVLRGGPCKEMDQCALHMPWLEARAALTERLDSISISSTKTKEESDV